MPLYDYKCAQCGRVSEVRHGFTDSWNAPCPSCGGSLARVFNPAPIVFKGSGFYVTDSRKSSSPGKASEAASAGAKSSETKSAETKSAEAKPAESKSESKTSGGSKASESAA